MQQLSELKKRLSEITEWLRSEFGTIRTGRATPAVLDSVTVDAYGTVMKIPQVATISIEGTKSLLVTPWDKGLASAIEKAIRDAGLGFSVTGTDQGVRVIFPELTTESRAALLKVVKQKHEEARVSVRAEREKVREKIKQQEEDGQINEDTRFRLAEEMQKLVDQENKELEELAKRKEAEVKGEE